MIRTSLCGLFILLAILGTLLPAIASAACSADDIRDYVQSGATPQQLAQLCGQSASGPSFYPSYPRPASIATVCVTHLGPCPMMEPVPIGSSCACATQVGTLPGMAR